MSEMFQTLMKFEHLIAAIGTLLLSVILWLLRRFYKRYKERSEMWSRKQQSFMQVMLFGIFDNQLQFEELGSLPTTVCPEELANLIIHWNDRSSPSIIHPDDVYLTDALCGILPESASFVLRSNGIGAYFDHAERYGTESYSCVKLVACMVRPDPEELARHDKPRIVLMEVGALRKVLMGEVHPTKDDVDGKAFLRIVEDVAAHYFGDDRSPMVELSIACKPQAVAELAEPSA